MIELTDDGTLDTVLRCSACGEEMRYNYQSSNMPNESPCNHGNIDGCEDCYDAFVVSCIEDASEIHDCGQGGN